MASTSPTRCMSTGATQSPIRFLIYLHLVAVSLLASYRTGLKIALWHSLLLFVVLYAQAAALLPPVDVIPGRGIEFDRMPVLNVTSFWLFALATSIFSAMNERELRQRRADLQALVDVGARLDEASRPGPPGAHRARRAGRSLRLRPGHRAGGRRGQPACARLAWHAELSTASAPADGIIRPAWERRELLPVKRLDPDTNPLLARPLPGARNLLISPMVADGRPVGAIVVEHRSRSVFGVERRVASVLGQFSAVAALNLRNAVLLRHVQNLAERDSLTGAANRHMFQLTLEQTLASQPSGTDVTAVLFVDLDDFKLVNDSLGHAAGDDCWSQSRSGSAAWCAQNDLVARLGGDEFAILTDDDAELTRSRAMAERLVRDLRVPYVLGEHTSPSRPASASPAAATRVAARRKSCATRTWRCTWPRPTARPASPSSTRACTPPSARGTSSAPSCSTRSTWASCGCLPADRVARVRPRSPASRRSCAGSTPSVGWWRRANSSRSPRRTARSCPSAAGSCARRASER